MKKKFIYLTDSQLDEFRVEKLLSDPLYRKYLKKQNLKGMAKIEKKVEETIKKTIVKEKIQTEEIFRKSIIKQVDKKITTLKTILLMQRSPEWADLYVWLRKFHQWSVEPCLSKDLFKEGAQLYLYGGPDDDGLLAAEHFEFMKKIYHTIQYGSYELFLTSEVSDIDFDKGNARINEIVDSFYKQLDKNDLLKQRFIDFIQQFDLHGFMCTPDIETFFLDWWDYSQFLIKIKRTELNSLGDMESTLLRQLRYFSSDVDSLNLLPRVYHRYLNLALGAHHRKSQEFDDLCLTLDLPVRSEVPIESVVNEYLHTLSHYFSKYAEYNFSIQKRAIEIKAFQRQFQSMFHTTLKSIDETDLNIAVVEVLYLKWSYERENEYDVLEFLKELIVLLDTKSTRVIENNFTNSKKWAYSSKTKKWTLDKKIKKLTDKDKAKIKIKMIKKITKIDREIHPIKFSLNKPNLRPKGFLYEISAGALRKKLERSHEIFTTN